MGKTDLCKSAVSPRVVSSGYILRCVSSHRSVQHLKLYCHCWRSRSTFGDLHLVAFGQVRAQSGYALAACGNWSYGTPAQRGPEPVGTIPRASYECSYLEKPGLPFCEISAWHHFM